jgi:hypothetical protein
MIPIDNTEDLIKNTSFKAGPDMDNCLWSDIVKAQNDATQTGLTLTAYRGFKVISKYAALAGVAAVLVFGVVYFAGLTYKTSRVYAAAIDALQAVRSVHGSGWTTYQGFGGEYETMDLGQSYPLELCEWITDNNECRSFYKEGFATEWDNGKRRYEYNDKKQQLHISPSRLQEPDLLAYFQSVRSRLEQLREKGLEVIELGQRQIGDREAIGWRVVKRNNKREDLWLDAHTNLVLEIQEHIQRDGQWRQWRHGSFVYDQEIPTHIRNYTVPDTDNIIYGPPLDKEFEEWKRCLQQIASYYQEHPLPETMELLEPISKKRYGFYEITPSQGRVPGIEGITVKPIRHALRGFLRSRVPSVGSLRVPKDLFNVFTLRYDLVIKDGQTLIDEIHFVLDTLGLELVESVEQRRVFVAHYDGRPLKPWQQVKAPVQQGDPHNDPGMDWDSKPITMPQLFEDFMRYQNPLLTSTAILIVNETGLSDKDSTGEDLHVSSASPYWQGEEIIDMARQWFKEQFGVTFTEETRPMTVYSVQRR